MRILFCAEQFIGALFILRFRLAHVFIREVHAELPVFIRAQFAEWQQFDTLSEFSRQRREGGKFLFCVVFTGDEHVGDTKIAPPPFAE